MQFQFLRKINTAYFQLRLKHKFSFSVILPKTQFPLHLSKEKLIERDKSINENDKYKNLYEWQRKNLSGPDFVLHDGPPYANGQPHMGHAINKILKDTILRYKILRGQKVHFIPGWDCHGLPIELKATNNLKDPDTLEIRNTAQNFAKETINVQKNTFMSWGLVGDWKKPYCTFSPDYIKNQFNLFYDLYNKNVIYRDTKPIYWSPSSKTALAEAELEYNEKHKTTAAYVRCEIKNLPKMDVATDKVMFALIWTTTPWTLPMNQAICYNPSLSYAICSLSSRSENELYIVAVELIEMLQKQFKSEIKILGIFPGENLSGGIYKHPINKNLNLPILPGIHVTAAKGTGLVHTAPAHGPEDYLVALKNRISVLDLVDEHGCFNLNADTNLCGKYVLSEGNRTVLELLNDDVIHKHNIVHSYPYDWRTKQPVIIKASTQWFIDTNSLKDKAMESLKEIDFVPSLHGKQNKSDFVNQVNRRPFWCISRQRKWGVPIPVFYEEENNNVIFNSETLKHHCHLLEKHGPNFWWELEEEQLLTKSMENNNKLFKGKDILDIWFDSGITWSYALEGEKIADLYLEGGDQFNGWFYSSLMTSIASRNKAPYKKVYVHGFAVDEKGIKMSKSLGNVVDPSDITSGSKGRKPYGIDVLRWWVSCHANQDSLVNVSKNVFQSCSEEVQKIRGVLRFILGSLNDYNGKELKYEDIYVTDKYLLNLLIEFDKQTKENYENFAFHRVGKSVTNLLANQISALYFSAIKDRLYCDLEKSVSRQSAQFTLDKILHAIIFSVGPILPHLVEEVYSYYPLKNYDTYFTSKHVNFDEKWHNDDVKKVMDVILDIRKNLHQQTGSNSNAMLVDIQFNQSIYKKLMSLSTHQQVNYELTHILQCASININCKDMSENYQLNISKSTDYLCPRCRRIQSAKEDDLCSRCNDVLNQMDGEQALNN